MKNLIFLTLLLCCATRLSAQSAEVSKEIGMPGIRDTVVLGAGCFWCIEATLQSFRGVESVESGYAGGTTASPTYEEHGDHAEVVRVVFDPSSISFKQLLTIFFHAHDPTTKNKQGNDIGPQYRSMILYHSDDQRRTAEETLKEIEEQRIWGTKPIVTEIKQLKDYYPAEDYHQNYYANNQNQGYCTFVIAPKLLKIRKEFHSLLK